MNGAGIGRVLVASLHQGIADVLPTRLEFYENWLNPAGLRNGTIGLAPLGAVLSFLREEGDAYDLVTGRAGEYAADWTFAGLSPARQRLIRITPPILRSRWTLRIARELVHDSYRSSRALVRLRKGVATVDLRGSIFCGVREPAERHLCGFYASAFVRLLDRFELPAGAYITQCRGVGDSACAISVALAAARASDVSVELS